MSVTIEIIDCNCKNGKMLARKKSKHLLNSDLNTNRNAVIDTRGGGAQIATSPVSSANKIQAAKQKLVAAAANRNIKVVASKPAATKKVTAKKVVTAVVNPASLVKNKTAKKVATVLTNPIKGTAIVAKGTVKAVKKAANVVKKVNPVNKIKNTKVKTAVQVALNPVKGTKVVAKATAKAAKKVGKAVKKVFKKKKK